MGLDPGRPGSLLTRASQNPPSRYCLEIRNGSRIGATKRPRGVKEVPIGCLLAPKKSARDTFCYFPNSFGETVWKFLATCQSPHHEPYHCRVDERLRALAKPLVVLAHPPVLP